MMAEVAVVKSCKKDPILNSGVMHASLYIYLNIIYACMFANI